MSFGNALCPCGTGVSVVKSCMSAPKPFVGGDVPLVPSDSCNGDIATEHERSNARGKRRRKERSEWRAPTRPMKMAKPWALLASA